MQNVLEQGSNFWCWFDKTQFSCHCVHAIHACKDVFNPNVIIESVDSISRDERDVPLTQDITNA